MPITPARDVAFRVLQAVAKGGYASDLLRRESTALSPRDAALAESIVLGALRYQSQLDFLIDHFAGRPNLKLDPEVRIALRMGVYQLRYLDRIPAHAAVAESVELVKKARKRSAAPLVNAILRKVNRDPIAWPSLAIELSIPAPMLERWTARYGADAAQSIARAALTEPEAYVNRDTGRQQDIGAQSIVPLLALEPAMTVLDLCSAPGNKTAQIVAAGGRVVAADRYAARLAPVPSDAARIVLDATAPLPFATKFDRILIDAPCSGTGTLAHNPEIKWRFDPKNLADYQTRQRQMIEQALPLLKPGGLLVYATCSLEPEENEDVIQSFAPTHSQLRLPGQNPGDGFFAAVCGAGRQAC